MSAALVDHEPFCLPRPGAMGPRVERFVQTRQVDDGTTLARTLTERCVECGAAHYTEV